MSFFQPHWEQSFGDGYQRSAFPYSAPYHRHLYSSFVIKPAIPASPMARDNFLLWIIPATFNVSTTTRPADLAIAVVALCWTSLLMLTTRA